MGSQLKVQAALTHRKFVETSQEEKLVMRSIFVLIDDLVEADTAVEGGACAPLFSSEKRGTQRCQVG